MLHTIDHIDLNVLSLEQTKSFYTALFVDFLGWGIIYDTNDYFMIGHLPGLRLGFSEVKYKYKNDLFNREKVGFHHFGIEVENRQKLDQIYQKLLQLNVQILDRPKVYPNYDNNFYAVYYLDPNGFKMEFITYEAPE